MKTVIMAGVLFIITIPTAIEEEHIQDVFMTKKMESEPAENCSNTKSEAIDNNCLVDLADTINTINADNPDNQSTTSKRSIDFSLNFQYDTFPKRKTVENRIKLIEDIGPIENNSKAEECNNSFKDIDAADSLSVSRKSWEGLRDVITSTKRKNQKKNSIRMDVEMPRNTSMEDIMKEIIRKFQIQSALWTRDVDGRMYQIIFTIEFDETYEKLLENLNVWGIGDREGSTISVVNCIASKTFSNRCDSEVQSDYNTEHNLAQKQGAWERFMNSVRSRLNVAQVVRDVRQDAAITFDFVVLLVSAAILASFGLIENSTIFLASSMLISPLMGPIIAAIFGTVIKDSSLRRLGIKNELFGILLAIFVGFLFGLIICSTDGRYGISEGLTAEMLARCELHSLIVGVFTAIASGAAAAIGILGGNIGSLVGVAISASLLPPAVNSGLIWSLAVLYKIFEKDETRYNNIVRSTIYSTNQATELAILGSISVGLTISNIICVYLIGILVLKVKEIAPVISPNNREFWKHDIKIARDLNRSGYDADTAIIDEFANLPKEDRNAIGIDYDLLRQTMSIDEALYQNTWSPIGAWAQHEPYYDPRRQNYSTIHRIERLYSTITNQQSNKEKSYKFGAGRRATGRLADIDNSYKMLSEKLPLPEKSVALKTHSSNATVTIGSTTSATSKFTSTSNTPTMNDDRKRRKFIVTPAEEDPLYYIMPSDDVEV